MPSLVIACLAFLFAGASSSTWHYGDENKALPCLSKKCENFGRHKPLPINSMRHWDGTCKTGKSQSPINLDDEIVQIKSFEKFVFSHYNIELPAIVKNNGHSVQVNLDVSIPLPNVKGGGLPKEYVLDHLHFHWQSEHTVNGHRFPLEVHLVHYANVYNNLTNALNYMDGVAVLGVLYHFSPDDDVEFDPLIKVVDNVQKNVNTPKPADKTRLSSFLPRDTAGYYRYNGSLTTPNCNEAVIWTVFTNTMPISKEQVKHFEAMQSDESSVPLKHNYRSLQSVGERTIYKKISPLPHGAARSNFEKPIAFGIILLVFLF